MYKILSIDGGGVRGIIAARIIARIVKERPSFLTDCSCMAGTSSGAITALALSNLISPQAVVNMFEQRSDRIFTTNPLKRLLKTWGIVAAKYSNKNLHASLTDLLQSATLSQLKKKVMIATFELDSAKDAETNLRLWRAKFFHNFRSDRAFKDDRIIDIAMRSCAAPTYLPIYQGFVDGGIIANNPSMCALAQVIDPKFGESNLDEVVLLSFGSGLKPEYDSSESSSRGLMQWGFKILSMVFQGNVGLVDYQCRQLLGDRYLRVNPELPAPFTIDDTSKLDKLIAIADGINLSPLLQWIDVQWTDVRSEMSGAESFASARTNTGLTPFEEALRFTLKWEGGYIDDKVDPGGATAFGITQRTYDAFRARQKQPLKAVALISSPEIRAIYYTEYWLGGRCQSMLPPLSTVFFDTCVNFGVHAATKFLQVALHTTADGILGPITAKKLSESIPLAIAWNICAQRITFRKTRSKNHPEFQKFLEGWLNRDFALQNYIREEVGSS